ncbi:Pimeloyl-ACP methyl ester carboxylesterase [Mesobacillus persicus]|uniref:Pimeloyl-ACP methyl ester carboxylesterase n=1 Tax=Mesobacillus persicus TaxID=930146 RepID=A0A1H8ISG8_9BACI|nr:alpha/beta hydrolase [Mesobacillus persicus]SEN71362.1 Pimeloyl-ACP methyl ester carboxylesterase [Mesobacillus persicus]
MYQAFVNGINLHYDRLGSGEPLVLIHGLGERKEGWKFQHELAEHFDLIIPDLRGFGKTECPEGEEITINVFAKDVVGLLDHLGIKEAHICGLSMGGIVSQEIYQIHPEKVKSFILASSISYVPNWLEKLLLFIREKRYQNMTYNQYTSKATLSCLYDHSDETVQKVIPAWSEHLDGFLPAWKATLKIDYRETLKKIDVPTLIIACQNDKILPTFCQKQMHKLIPNSKLHMIKKAGHVGKIEKAEEFNTVVLDFLLEDVMKSSNVFSA